MGQLCVFTEGTGDPGRLPEGWAGIGWGFSPSPIRQGKVANRWLVLLVQSSSGRVHVTET